MPKPTSYRRYFVGAAFCFVAAACKKSPPRVDAPCPSREPVDYVTIDQPCVDGGDPDEDVDVAHGEKTGKKYSPRPALAPELYASVPHVPGFRERERDLTPVDTVTKPPRSSRRPTPHASRGGRRFVST